MLRHDLWHLNKMGPTDDFSTLPDLFAKSVEKFANRPHFGTKRGAHWQWVSYAEFGQQVSRAYAAMVANQVRKGDRIGLISNNCVEWAVLTYAALHLGAVIVPMYESQQDQEWRFILDNSESTFVFVSSASVLKRVEAFVGDLTRVRQLVYWGEASSEKAIAWTAWLNAGSGHTQTLSSNVTPDDLAQLIYTSGTTGNPKGVMLTQRNLASNVSAFQGLFDISDQDVSLSFLPWAHAFGQTAELHMLTSVGAAIGIAESVEKIIHNLGEIRPNILISVPRIFNRIYDGLQKKMQDASPLQRAIFAHAMRVASQKRALAERGKKSALIDVQSKILDHIVFAKVRERFGGRLRLAVSGGAALSPEVARFIDNLGINVYEGYGLSEASPVVAVNTPAHRRIGSVGRPLRNVQVHIAKSERDGEAQQEIWVRGPNVMQGYYKLPEETRDMLDADGYLHTGDMGYIDADGFLFITGRIKEKYKLENGKFVVPTLLEEQLKLSPFVLNAFVWGEDKPFNVALLCVDREALEHWAKQSGVAYASWEALLRHPEVEKLIESEIKIRLTNMKHYEKIKKFALIDQDFTVDNNMLTPSLKVKRRVVMKHYGERILALY